MLQSNLLQSRPDNFDDDDFSIAPRAMTSSSSSAASSSSSSSSSASLLDGLGSMVPGASQNTAFANKEIFVAHSMGVVHERVRRLRVWYGLGITTACIIAVVGMALPDKTGRNEVPAGITIVFGLLFLITFLILLIRCELWRRRTLSLLRRCMMFDDAATSLYEIKHKQWSEYCEWLMAFSEMRERRRRMIRKFLIQFRNSSSSSSSTSSNTSSDDDHDHDDDIESGSGSSDSYNDNDRDRNRNKSSFSNSSSFRSSSSSTGSSGCCSSPASLYFRRHFSFSLLFPYLRFQLCGRRAQLDDQHNKLMACSLVSVDGVFVEGQEEDTTGQGDGGEVEGGGDGIEAMPLVWGDNAVLLSVHAAVIDRSIHVILFRYRHPNAQQQHVAVAPIPHDLPDAQREKLVGMIGARAIESSKNSHVIVPL